MQSAVFIFLNFFWITLFLLQMCCTPSAILLSKEQIKKGEINYDKNIRLQIQHHKVFYICDRFYSPVDMRRLRVFNIYSQYGICIFGGKGYFNAVDFFSSGFRVYAALEG
jgi:hypothetical protein